MPDNANTTQGDGSLVVAADDIAGVKHQRVKVSVGPDGVAADMSSGAGAVSAATPRVTLASDDPAVAALGVLGGYLDSVEALIGTTNTEVGGLIETAPATDTASSGLNGRLQRVAQRLTSLIALLPASLGSKAAASSLAVTQSTEDAAQLGSLTETAPASDTASSGLNGRLQRIAQRITSLIALIPTSLATGGGLRVTVQDTAGASLDYTVPALVEGGTADDAAIGTRKPVGIGGQAKTANRTAVSDGDIVHTTHDKLGKVIAVAAVRELKGKQVTTLTSTTTETTIVTAGGASVFRDVYGLIIENTSASACEVTIRDVSGAGTAMPIMVPAGDTRGFMLDAGSAIPQGTANSAWTAQCGTSVASIKVTALFVANL